MRTRLFRSKRVFYVFKGILERVIYGENLFFEIEIIFGLRA
jgi:hypothetical protein